MKMNSNNCCEFCTEFLENSQSPFNHIYQDSLNSRIVYTTQYFVALPTIGQFVDNYLLLLPKKHYESLSELSVPELIELSETFNFLKSYLAKYGEVIAFEHGAKRISGGGCGVYHAHLHIIPLHSSIDLFSFFKHKVNIFDSLTEAYGSLSDSEQYMVVINADNKVGTIDLTNDSNAYPSQFMRKSICNALNINMPWNWREYKQPEERLISIVNQYSL